MADATTVIKLLGEQIAQLVIDKTIAQVEVAELKDKLSALEPAE